MKQLNLKSRMIGALGIFLCLLWFCPSGTSQTIVTAQTDFVTLVSGASTLPAGFQLRGSGLTTYWWRIDVISSPGFSVGLNTWLANPVVGGNFNTGSSDLVTFNLVSGATIPAPSGTNVHFHCPANPTCSGYYEIRVRLAGSEAGLSNASARDQEIFILCIGCPPPIPPVTITGGPITSRGFFIGNTYPSITLLNGTPVNWSTAPVPPGMANTASTNSTSFNFGAGTVGNPDPANTDPNASFSIPFTVTATNGATSDDESATYTIYKPIVADGNNSRSEYTGIKDNFLDDNLNSSTLYVSLFGGSGSFTFNTTGWPPGFSFSGTGRRGFVTMDENVVTAGSYTLNLDVIDNNVPGSSFLYPFTVTLTENPPQYVDVIFVIDLSGSMDWMGLPADRRTGCDGRYCDYTRYEVVKEIFPFIVNFWNGLNITTDLSRSDRVGLVFFNHDKIIYNRGGVDVNNMEDALVEGMETLTDRVCGSIRGLGPLPAFVCRQTPNGSTSLGLGLWQAQKILASNPTANTKHIVLLTDGMQNTAPMVVPSGSFLSVTHDGVTYTFNRSSGVEIHALGIFAPNEEFTNLLRKLADDTGNDDATAAFAQNMVDYSALQNRDAENGMLMSLVKAFSKKGSPKIVLNKVGRLQGTQSVEEFSINGDFNKLVIGINKIGATDLRIKVEKINGSQAEVLSVSAPQSKANISPDYQTAPQNPYRVFAIDFDTFSKTGFDKIGLYRVTVTSPNANSPYKLRVVTDDIGIKYKALIQPGNHRAGDDIRLETRLNSLNAAITSNATVTAKISYPKKSVSKLFAETKMPRRNVTCNCSEGSPERKKDCFSWVKHYAVNDEGLEIPFENPNVSLSEKKSQILYTEKDFYSKLSQQETQISLVHVGKGVYRTTFNDTKDAGLYNVEFDVRVNTASGGTFQRTESQSTVVTFGKPEFSTSQVRLFSENLLTLAFKPKDIYKNYLGANRSGEIDVSVTHGTVSSLSDYTNGRYVSQLQGNKLRYKDKLLIKVMGDLLYHGKLWKLLHRYTFATQAGIAFPTGDFKNNYQRNYFLEGKFGVRLVTGLFLQFEGSYYNFKSRADFSDLSISGGGLGLQYNFPIKPGSGWNLYLDGNVGYYKPDNQDAAIGFSGALGITKTVRPNLALVLEGKYRHIDTSPDPVTFAAGSLGLRYSFSELFPKNKVPCKCTDCRFFLLPSCISLNYGRAFATGDTKNNYADGSLYEVGLNYPVVNDFKIVAEGGYYQLKGESNAGDISMYRAGLGFYANFGSNRIIPTIGGSLGYYWPDNIDAGFGIKTTGGLRFPISSKSSDIKRFTILVDGNYYRIFGKTSDVEFLGLSGGITYCF